MSHPSEHGVADLLRYQAQGLRKQAEQELEDMRAEGHQVVGMLRKSAGTVERAAAESFLQKTAGVHPAVPFGEDLVELRISVAEMSAAAPVFVKQASPVVAPAAATTPVFGDAGVTGTDADLVKAAEDDVCRRLLTGEIDRDVAEAALTRLRLMRGAA